MISGRGKSLSNDVLLWTTILKVKFKDTFHGHRHKGFCAGVGGRGALFSNTLKVTPGLVTSKKRGVLSGVKVKGRWKDPRMVCCGWRTPWLSWRWRKSSDESDDQTAARRIPAASMPASGCGHFEFTSATPRWTDVPNKLHGKSEDGMIVFCGDVQTSLTVGGT